MPLSITMQVPVPAEWLTRDDFENELSHDPDTLIELLAEDLADIVENPRALIREIRWIDTLPSTFFTD